MSIKEYEVSAVMKRNSEIEDIGQQLYELSVSINKLEEEIQETNEHSNGLCVDLRQTIHMYWSLYHDYQDMVYQMYCDFGVHPSDHPFWSNPHLAVLQANE